MKKTKIFYYLFTILFSVSTLMGSYFELTQAPMAVEAINHLGYPTYFNYILGVAKALGVIALWQTFSPTLKEWAYAGFTFNMLGAATSVLANGDPMTDAFAALLSFAFLMISYFTFRKIKASKSEITVVRA